MTKSQNRVQMRRTVMVAVCVSAGIISGMTVGSGRVELCAGGCMTRGIPVPMQGAEQAIHHSKSKMLAQQSVAAEAKKARVQQLDAYTEGDWNNAVQLGNQDHQWKKYAEVRADADESVMGKPYEDHPFGATVESVPIHNPSRDWAPPPPGY